MGNAGLRLCVCLWSAVAPLWSWRTFWDNWNLRVERLARSRDIDQSMIRGRRPRSSLLWIPLQNFQHCGFGLRTRQVSRHARAQPTLVSKHSLGSFGLPQESFQLFRTMSLGRSKCEREIAQPVVHKRSRVFHALLRQCVRLGAEQSHCHRRVCSERCNPSSEPVSDRSEVHVSLPSTWNEKPSSPRCSLCAFIHSLLARNPLISAKTWWRAVCGRPAEDGGTFLWRAV